MNVCAKLGCREKGSHRPLLEFYTPGFDDPIQALLGMVICDAHTATSKPEDFLTDQGWEQICAEVGKLGKPLPLRQLTRVRMVRL